MPYESLFPEIQRKTTKKKKKGVPTEMVVGGMVAASLIIILVVLVLGLGRDGDNTNSPRGGRIQTLGANEKDDVWHFKGEAKEPIEELPAIRTKGRWGIEWSSLGKIQLIQAKVNGEQIWRSIYSADRGAGYNKIYAGEAGTFILRIGATGPWKIKIYKVDF